MPANRYNAWLHTERWSEKIAAVMAGPRRATSMSYQTFQGVAGDSDSPAKLDRLHLPTDLSGLSVLDVACNEGFFCQEAVRRGATRVVGIDKNPDVHRKGKEAGSEL